MEFKSRDISPGKYIPLLIAKGERYEWALEVSCENLFSNALDYDEAWARTKKTTEKFEQLGQFLRSGTAVQIITMFLNPTESELVWSKGHKVCHQPEVSTDDSRAH